MKRDINLIRYLPPYLKEYTELAAILNAENPEFKLADESAEKLLNNMFIETADEHGISRFEKLLNITPASEDTLESRRKRVMFLWNFKVPYTMRYLKEKLTEICGDDYSLSIRDYCIDILTHLFEYGDMENVRNMLIEMIPCNMKWGITNDLTVSKLNNYYGNVSVLADVVKISFDLPEELVNVNNNTKFGDCNMLHSVVTIAAENQKEA